MKDLRLTHSSSSSISTSSPASFPWIHLRSILFVVTSSSPAYCSSTDRSLLKSPRSYWKRKSPLTPQKWKSLFSRDGKLRDGGVKLLKRVRRRGVDPSIRAEVWPFLLGVYGLNTSRAERDTIRTQKRKEYEKLCRKSQHLLKCRRGKFKMNENDGSCCFEDSGSLIQDAGISSLEGGIIARQSFSSVGRKPEIENAVEPSHALLKGYYRSRHKRNIAVSALNIKSTDSDSTEDLEVIQASRSFKKMEEGNSGMPLKENISPLNTETRSNQRPPEDFATWQRIIRLDAVRAHSEWIPYCPSQVAVSRGRACRSAEAVGLKDYNNLEPCQVYHAARLVSILDAYALYDPEIGYCQGMSDLLSPIAAVITEDHEAFWCFVGCMKKARHNFRLDELGIQRQLNIVSRIIKSKDSHLYRHLVKLQAEDCFFVYRMVVVMFRRELTFEQTLCLWEIVWADQTAIRAGIGNSAWNRMKHRAPPTDDLLLYAVAASILQRRNLIIEKYSSVDEIVRECNNMTGKLNVWKLLNDAHELVMTLRNKVERALTHSCLPKSSYLSPLGFIP